MRCRRRCRRRPAAAGWNKSRGRLVACFEPFHNRSTFIWHLVHTKAAEMGLGLSAAPLAASPPARSTRSAVVQCLASGAARPQAATGGSAAAAARRPCLAATRQRQCTAASAAAAAGAAGAPSQDITADVCILGAGIIGLCSALVLLRADPSLRVVLIDRKVPCSGATGAGEATWWGDVLCKCALTSSRTCTAAQP